MSISGLPTDRLYKVKALGGLLMAATFFTLFFNQLNTLVDSVWQIEEEVSVLEVDMSLASGESGFNDAKRRLASIEARFSYLKDKVRVFRISGSALMSLALLGLFISYWGFKEWREAEPGSMPAG